MFDPQTQRQEFSGDLIYNPRRRAGPGDTYMLDAAQARSVKQMVSMLDSQEAVNLWRRLLGHYKRELDRQAMNRIDMAVDDDFYDHIQYTPEEMEVLAERGQMPVVYNQIQTMVNWLLGTQRRSSTDYRILPRKKDGLAAAERKTQLLKHVDDANGASFEVSDAFASAVKAGMGWLETGQGRPEDGPQVYLRSESWRVMLHDSTALQYSLDDARYLFRVKWLDLDMAHALWPHRKGLISGSITGTSLSWTGADDLGDVPMDSIEAEHFNSYSSSSSRLHYGAERDRVRVIEAWFKRIDPRAAILSGGQFNGELFDEWSRGHWNEVASGAAKLVIGPKQVIYVALMTETGLLDLRRSPYRHNRYPFVPLWAYRRARDGMPYGIIRGVRDLQRDLNKRGSKAIHYLSATRVLYEEGSLRDPETTRSEAARPDAMIGFKKGYQPPQIETATDLAAAHVEIMHLDSAMIQQVGGVTEENLGRTTTARSGIAIQRKQDQGALTTAHFFENLRRTRLLTGERLLVNVEQFYTASDIIRITDTRGNPDYLPINDGNPQNAISDYKADFVISEEDWRATVRQAQAEQLLNLAEKLAATAPQLVVNILDLVVEALDVPKRDELVKRIRTLTGVDDPDADPNNPSPEAIASQQQKQAMEALNQRMQMAQIGKAEAEARKANATAAAQEQTIATDAIATLIQAMDAALAVAGAPAVAEAADRVLLEATKSTAALLTRQQQPEMA